MVFTAYTEDRLAVLLLGTYNNQYMVLDLNKVKLRQGIEDGALYIVEQIPTLIKYGDQTDLLRLG